MIDRSAAQIQTTWEFCLDLNTILAGVAARISPDSIIWHPATVMSIYAGLLPSDRDTTGSIPMIETLYLKLISCTGEMTDDVSSFCSPPDKFLIYRLELAGKSRVSSHTTLSIGSSCLSLSPLLLRNNLHTVCLRTDNTCPFTTFQLVPSWSAHN